MAKAEERAKVFKSMDQQSIKSNTDVMKKKNPVVQSRAIERDAGDDQNYLGNPRGHQTKDEDQRI